MNRQTKARVERLLRDYADENKAGTILLCNGNGSFDISSVGDANQVVLGFVYGLASFTERYIEEDQEREFLATIFAEVYSNVLQHRKEKADATDNQGQSGDQEE